MTDHAMTDPGERASGPDRDEETRSLGDSGPGESPELAALVADYVDRFSRGETISSGEILAAHPRLGPELLRELQVFFSLDESTPIEPMVGTLGDFDLQREIGSGGMGIVYDAWQRSMERRVALKTLSPAIATNNRAAARFAREARAAGALHHPAIVPVFAMGIDQGQPGRPPTPYFAMEFVEGETVAAVIERLREGVAPEARTPLDLEHVDDDAARRVALLFADIADGLQHAHAHGVVHRDVKPSNIMLDRSGRLRLLDFGLARLEGDETLTMSSDRVGTLLYMSPEQAAIERVEVDHRTDVYSLGVTLYEVLTRETPFRGASREDTLSRIASEDPRPLRAINPAIPVDAETIVLKCLRKSPGDRYGTAEALKQDLERFARGDPIEARPETRLERWVRQARRRASLVAVIGLIGLLVLLGAILGTKLVLDAERERIETYERRVTLAAGDLLRGSTTAAANFQTVLGGAPTGLVVPQDEQLFWSSEDGATPVSRAIAVLEEEAASLPERFEAHYYLARAHLVNRDAERARYALRRCLELEPGFAPAIILAGDLGLEIPAREPGETWGELWIEADRLSRQARWSEAAERYRELRTSDGEHFLGSGVELRLAAGITALKAGQRGDALIEFAAACDLDRTVMEPWLLLGGTYLRGNDPEQAERIFHRLHESWPRRSESALWIAATYRRLVYPELALEWADRIEQPGIRARVRAHCHYALTQLDEGLEQAEIALGINERDISARLAFARCATPRADRDRKTHRNLLDRAITRLEGIHDFDPEFDLTWSNYSGLIAARGDTERAVELDRAALEQYPDHPILLARLARRVWPDHARVIELFELAREKRGLNVAHESSGTWSYAIWSYQASHQPDRAREEAELAAKYYPHARWVHLVRGFVLRQQRRLERSASAFEQALELEPPGDMTIRYLVKVLVELGRAGEAVDHARREYERAPAPEAANALGEAYRASGDLLESARWHARAILLESEFDRYAYGKLYAVLVIASAALDLPELGELVSTFEGRRGKGRLNPIERLSLALLRARGPSPDLEAALSEVTPLLAIREERILTGALVAVATIEADRGNACEAVRQLERAIEVPAHGHYWGDGYLSEIVTLLERYRKECSASLSSSREVERRLAAIASGEPPGALAAPVPLCPRPPGVAGRERIAAAAPELLAATAGAPPGTAAAGVRNYLEGRLLALAGKPEEAVERFRAVLEQDASADRARAQLAASLWQAGRRDEARKTIAAFHLERQATATPGWFDLCVNRWKLPWPDVLAELEAQRPRADHPRQAIVIHRDGGVLRINCGGKRPSTDPAGRQWLADHFYDGRTAADSRALREIDDSLGEVYRVPRRFFAGGYRIPVPDGRYHVRLYFAENLATQPGGRVFDVEIEGRRVLEAYEPLAAAGGLHKPDVRVFEAVVRDGELRIDMRPSKGEALIWGVEVERVGE